MAKTDLRFVGFRTVTQELDEHRRWVNVNPPRHEIVAATPSGQTRSIPLGPTDLARLFGQVTDIIGKQLIEQARHS